jgi:G3E family GTPase
MGSVEVAKTPVTVIAGYLGAGKTTLINACLQTRGERKIAVLVNDFGDINIDAALIESQTDTVLNLAGGCVCCSIGSDFMDALFELAALPQRFDHVLVETSGVALPKPIAQSIALSQSFEVESIFVLADRETIQQHLKDVYVGDLVRQQLHQADCILLTKSDLIGVQAKEGGAALGLVSSAPIYALPLTAYSCDWLLAPDARGSNSVRDLLLTSGESPATARGHWLTQPDGKSRLKTVGGPNESGSANLQAFDSLAIELDAPIDLARVKAHLLQLASGPVPMLLRAKGFVRDRSKPEQLQLLQMVGQRLNLTDVTAQTESQTASDVVLVLIGLRHEMITRRAELDAFIALLQE